MPTESNDIISIRSVQDVWGLGGDDEFRWYSGNANVYGGNSNEHYDTDYYGEKNGGDRLIVMLDTNLRVRFKSTEDGTIETAGGKLTFTGIERLHLGDGNDVVNASGASLDRYGLSIYAEGGNDKVVGTRFNDFIDPGDGNDLIRAGAGHDFINGSKGDDTVYGGAGDDNIRWGWGDPRFPVGNDKLYGGGGQDLVNVWVKEEYLNSNGVEVKISKVDAAGSMTGSSFTDYGGSRSTLKFQGFELGWTHEGKDYVSGADAKIVGQIGIQWSTRTGDDVLIGSRGNDMLAGGSGKDTITGGRGDDQIVVTNSDWADPSAPGDGYRDTLIFRAGDGHDTVYAFEVSRDWLDLDDRDYKVTGTNQGARLDFDNGDWILLRNISVAAADGLHVI